VHDRWHHRGADGAKYDENRGGPKAIAMDLGTHFLYTADRYSETVTEFTIDSTTGHLTFQGGVYPTESFQRFPWALTVAPSGGFVYVVNTGNNLAGQTGSVATYEITDTKGHLQLSGPPVPAGLYPDAIAIVDFSPPPPPPGVSHDLDGDGRSDILWRHTSGGVYEWLMNGTSVIGQGSPGSAGTDWTIVGVGDFNGDGKADLLWRHTSGTLYIWFMAGTTIIGQGSPGSAGTAWQIQ
jgi:hypothetical protein